MQDVKDSESNSDCENEARVDRPSPITATAANLKSLDTERISDTDALYKISSYDKAVGGMAMEDMFENSGNSNLRDDILDESQELNHAEMLEAQLLYGLQFN